MESLVTFGVDINILTLFTTLTSAPKYINRFMASASATKAAICIDVMNFDYTWSGYHIYHSFCTNGADAMKLLIFFWSKST